MAKQAEPSAAAIRLTTNAIFEGRFYTAGEPLPVASVADLPENLRPLVVTDEPEPEEPNEARGSFQMGVLYETTADGRLGRQLRRRVEQQISELESENDRADWIEETATAELPEAIAEDLLAEHESAIALAKAQAAADARRSDEVSDAAAERAEPPQLFVRRGSRHYAPIGSARLKPGEPVFTRERGGRFECIGTTDGNAELPDLPIIL
jgi:hypothetical protein